MSNLKRLLLLPGLAIVSSAANAAIVWYGGDFDRTNGLAEERNTGLGAGNEAWTYDDFTLASPTYVTAVFSNCLSSTGNTNTADYEIRSGVSLNNGGTLLFSGTGVAATRTATGRSGFGFIEYQYRISGLNNAMAPGHYWVAVRPVGDGTGLSFVATTVGLNGIGTPLNNDMSFFTSAFFGANFDSAAVTLARNSADFSMGVESDLVPEPVTMLALAGGLVALISRRRK